MRLLKYILTYDTGLAPNPYGEFCTLALCTPNHMSARLFKGDWILGHSAKSTGNKLIYLMKLTEDPMTKHQYFHDERFKYKKPVKTKNAYTFLGDNMYHIVNGKYVKEKGLHDTEKDRKKDLRKDKVYISNYFFYFGKSAIDIKEDYPDFIHDTQGIRYVKNVIRINKLISFIEKRYHEPGKIGEPTI
ncbi:MAG: hypothetical protein WC139_12940 [Candidatus Kapaibacterium sp.]